MRRSDSWTAMSPKSNPPGARLRTGVADGVAATIVLAFAAVLLLVFAATLALAAMIASVLLALSALAWRVRPQERRALVRVRGGHAWIAYSLDASSR